MLSAGKIFKELQQQGVTVLGSEESQDPKYMDGEVVLENSLSVQVGFDYVCLCLNKEDGIDYLLEVEGVYNEIDIATQLARFLQARSS